MDLDDLLADPPPKTNHNAGCGFGRWLQTLDEDARESIRKALADDRWEHAALTRTLAENLDMPCGTDTLTRHRKHGCKCGDLGLR